MGPVRRKKLILALIEIFLSLLIIGAGIYLVNMSKPTILNFFEEIK